MIGKKLWILIGILALLLAAVGAKELLRSDKDVFTHEDLASFFPKAKTAADVERIEIYKGEDNEQKIALVRKGDVWLVASHFDAPADGQKVEKALEEIIGLQGEYRADGEEILPEFELNKEAALNWVLYEQGDKPLLHLLAGKDSGWQNCFVRKASSEVVYLADVNLKMRAGISGDELKDTMWLDLKVLSLEKNMIQKAAWNYDGKSVVYEKKVTEPEAPADPDKADATDGEAADKTDEAADEGDAALTPPAQPKVEWVKAEGTPPKGLQDRDPKIVIEGLASVRAADIVDPTKKTELGLDAPQYNLTVTLEDGSEKNIAAVKSKDGSESYLLLNDKPLIYKVAAWQMDKLFPKEKENKE